MNCCWLSHLFFLTEVISGFATMTIGSSKSDHAAYFISIPTAMFTAFRCYTGECVTDEGFSITSKMGFDFGLPFIFGYVISYMLVTLGIFNVILAVYAAGLQTTLRIKTHLLWEDGWFKRLVLFSLFFVLVIACYSPAVPWLPGL